MRRKDHFEVKAFSPLVMAQGDGSGQAWDRGAKGVLQTVAVVGGSDATTITLRDGGASGTIMAKISAGVGENIQLGRMAFSDGVHVTFDSGTDAIIMLTGPSTGKTTAAQAATVTISTPTGGGGAGSGTFNGTTGFTDFTEESVGASPASWTMLNEGTNDHTHEIMAFGGANDSPLGNQVLRMLWGTTGNADSAMQWNAVDAALGEGEDGEILALVRHPLEDGNSYGPFPALALRFTTGNVYCSSFGGRSAFFTQYRRALPTDSLDYNNSSLPRFAQGVWHWVRVQRIGTAIKGKWWVYGAAEGAWRYEATVSDLPLGGGVGISVASPIAGNTTGYMVAYFAFTTDPSGSPLSEPA